MRAIPVWALIIVFWIVLLPFILVGRLIELVTGRNVFVGWN